MADKNPFKKSRIFPITARRALRHQPACLNCLKSNKVCTGAACLRAMNSRAQFFERYGDVPLELAAMARCNGCEAGVDAGFQEKLERMVQEGAEVVHLGKCTARKDGAECPVITEAAEYLAAYGIEVVRGTH